MEDPVIAGQAEELVKEVSFSRKGEPGKGRGERGEREKVKEEGKDRGKGGGEKGRGEYTEYTESVCSYKFV